MRKLICFLVFSGVGFCQSSATVTSTTQAGLSGTQAVLAVQNPSSSTHSITFDKFSISCSGSGTVSFSIQTDASSYPGSGATPPAFPRSYHSTANIFTSLPNSAGTVFSSQVIGTTGHFIIDMSSVYWPAGQGHNVVAFTNSTTSLCSLTFTWNEKSTQ